MTQFTMSGTGATRTFSFTSTGTFNEPNAVPRGNYQVILNANLVTSVSTGEPLDGNSNGVAGDSYTTSFFFQPGDLNHDRRVNVDDYGRIDGNINKSPQPQGYSEGDVNYDGKINLDDYGIMDASVGSSPLLPPPPTADLDVFEDENSDGIHDNSDLPEHMEATGSTLLPLPAIGERVKLALVLSGVTANHTVSFGIDPSVFSLSYDLAGTDPIPANTPVEVGTFGLSGNGTATLYGGAVAEGRAPDGFTVSLAEGGGSFSTEGSFAVLTGGATADTTGGLGPRGGGVEDEDGSQLLTDRDDFQHNLNTKLLVVGFAGHTQTEGNKPQRQGAVWNVETESGIYKFGERLRSSNFAVTIFQEDPGNNNFHEVRFCGDGVLGFHSDPANPQSPRSGGALPFVVNAIKTGKVRDLALFGYSHGASTVKLLTELLVDRLNPASPNYDSQLAQNFGEVKWTAYIDAVEVVLDEQTGDPTGLHNPEAYAPIITRRHFNVWQDATVVAPLWEPQGMIIEDDFEHNPSFAILDFNIDADNPPPEILKTWPDEVYHWDKEGQPGLAEQDGIQNAMWTSFIEAIVNS